MPIVNKPFPKDTPPRPTRVAIPPLAHPRLPSLSLLHQTPYVLRTTYILSTHSHTHSRTHTLDNQLASPPPPARAPPPPPPPKSWLQAALNPRPSGASPLPPKFTAGAGIWSKVCQRFSLMSMMGGVREAEGFPFPTAPGGCTVLRSPLKLLFVILGSFALARTGELHYAGNCSSRLLLH